MYYIKVFCKIELFLQHTKYCSINKGRSFKRC
jgi:hypothetical protein